jgi:hypothetical protein
MSSKKANGIRPVNLQDKELCEWNHISIWSMHPITEKYTKENVNAYKYENSQTLQSSYTFPQFWFELHI